MQKKELENMTIYDAVRAATSPEFVIGIRLGGFEPALSDGIAHAKAMEDMGMEFLDISYGFAGEMEMEAPGDPRFSAAVRAAGAVKAAVEAGEIAAERYESYLGMLEEENKYR